MCSAYFECVNEGGIVELDTTTDSLIDYFQNITGYLSATPAGDLILAPDPDTNIATVLTPQGEHFLLSLGGVIVWMHHMYVGAGGGCVRVPSYVCMSALCLFAVMYMCKRMYMCVCVCVCARLPIVQMHVCTRVF